MPKKNAAQKEIYIHICKNKTEARDTRSITIIFSHFTATLHNFCTAHQATISFLTISHLFVKFLSISQLFSSHPRKLKKKKSRMLA